jgi:hypothetical protein
MSQAIPSQHPAVVLRSHYNHMRALLAVAMIALVGLTAAVVILATDDDPGTSASSATQVRAPSQAGSTGYEGGPDEGTADVSGSQSRVTQSQAFPGLAGQANGAHADGRRFDGGPDEGTRGSGH